MSVFQNTGRGVASLILGGAGTATDPSTTSTSSASPFVQGASSLMERLGRMVVPGVPLTNDQARNVGTVFAVASAARGLIDRATEEAHDRAIKEQVQREERTKQEEKDRQVAEAKRVAVEERNRREQAEALTRRAEAERAHLEESLHLGSRRTNRLILPPPIPSGTNV